MRFNYENIMKAQINFCTICIPLILKRTETVHWSDIFKRKRKRNTWATGPFKSHFHISEVIAVFESTAALWYKWHLVLLRKIIHFKFWFGNTSSANLDQWTAGSEDKNEFPSWTERIFPGAASRTLVWVGDVSVWHRNVTAVIISADGKTNQL